MYKKLSLRLLLLVSLFLSTSIISSGQAPRCYKKVLFFDAYSHKTLARHLTRGLSTDSEKVAAIHSWIAHNIRYDLKKSMHAYKRVSVKKILRTKKAVCTGYADLFTQLCGDAGIKSVPVEGYVKSIWIDIEDTFFIDEHEWNAVLVGGKWQLVDPTWDAGYTQLYRKTFGGYLACIFTFGRHKPIEYKPRFVHKPDNTYFLKTGDAFIYDHIPLNPKWELLQQPESMDQFARDSSYYYKKRGYSHLPAAPTGSEDYGDSYYEMTPEEKTIEDGKRGYRFNYRNHLCIGDADLRMAGDEVEKLAAASKASDEQVGACNSILKKTSLARLHYDSCKVFIDRRKKSELFFNAKKRTIFAAYNGPMLRNTEKIAGRLNSARTSCGTAAKNCAATVKTNLKRGKSISADESFYKIRPAKNTRGADSAEAAKQIRAMQDSIAKQKRVFANTYSALENQYGYVADNLTKYQKEERNSILLVMKLTQRRAVFMDDLDYEIKPLADTLKTEKAGTDSLLYTDGKFLISQLSTSLGKVKTAYNTLAGFYNEQAAALKKMQSACRQNNIVATEFANNRDSLIAYLNAWNAILANWQGRYRQLQLFCKYQVKVTNFEVKKLEEDKLAENSNNRNREKNISGDAASGASIADERIRATERLKKQIEAYKTSLGEAGK